MKKLIILLFIITPIIGYSQSDVFGSTTTLSTIQFGNHNTFQGVHWRDKISFERSAQDRINTTRSRNDNRIFTFGRIVPSKMKYKRWLRQYKRAFKRV